MSSWSCAQCPPCPPRIFEQTGKEQVNDVFFAAYNVTTKQWRYPVFFKASDYTGDTSPVSIPLASGETLAAFRSANYDTTSTAQPDRFPVLVSKGCNQKCIRSSSDYLQQRKRENMLKAVQNDGVDCPMDCENYLLYKQSTQLIVPHFTCNPC